LAGSNGIEAVSDNLNTDIGWLKPVGIGDNLYIYNSADNVTDEGKLKQLACPAVIEDPDEPSIRKTFCPVKPVTDGVIEAEPPPAVVEVNPDVVDRTGAVLIGTGK
jgi:hypothetical protein